MRLTVQGRSPVYNEEGYLDLTAYLAIKNVIAEESEDYMSYWQSGDIIKLRLYDEREVYRIVLKAHERYATTLALYDDESRENEFQVTITGKIGKKHADLGRLAYTKNRDLESAEFVRTMDDAEFRRLLSRIMETIGVPTIVHVDEACQKWEEQYKELQKYADSLTGDNTNLVNENAALRERIAELEAERVSHSEGEDELSKAMGMIEVLKKDLESSFEKLSAETERSAAARAGVIKAEAERDVYKELYMGINKAFAGIPISLAGKE